MHNLGFYLQLGFQHISNLAGLDHILFLVALCAVYRLAQWRNIVVLVTAFTVGHSVTLAMASFGTLVIPSNIIEFLIPLTILVTALHNLVSQNPTKPGTGMWRSYTMALLFGFIHGMGFSNYFRALLMGESSIAIPLLGFNLGIELGQLFIIFFVVAIGYLFLNIIGVKHREWNVFISGATASVAVMLMVENRFW